MIEDEGRTAPADVTGNVVCGNCGASVALSTTGRPKQWCSDACRKAAKRAELNAGSRQLGRTAVPHGPEARVRQAPGFGAGRREVQAAAKPDTTFPQVSEFPDTLGLDVSAGQRADEPVGLSWSYAKFASPGTETAGQSRRSVRYKLRQLLRDITTVERCQRCGRDVLGGAVMLKIKDGVAHFSGVESCGRIWLCPVCSAKVRARRGDEIAEAVGRWIGRGGGAYFATATLPHDQGDALAASLDVLTKSWRLLTSGKGYQTEKERFGIVGNIKALEVTHGRNGWHPHIHAVVLTGVEVELMHLCDWFGRLDARWSRALVRNGWAPGKNGYRFRLDLVNRSTAVSLAAYVTKVQDGVGLGNEIARADLKSGKKSNRTPLQILADFGTYGDASDLDLWLEYERATQGKSALRWSRGLRDLLLPEAEEQTDEEIAAEEIGGEEVAALLPHTWYRITEIPGAESAVLDAVEAGGWNGLLRTLLSYRIPIDGVMTPQDWAAQGVEN